ncbi:MAG: aminopeptidase N [Candidatus Cloacimonadota bacterium]|nr:MAG: aminopeptidase N [Candidatus Cloacimonadota bacterium]
MALNDNLLISLAQDRAKNYTNLQYHLNLLILGKQDSYSGSVEIKFDLLKKPNEIILDSHQGEINKLLVNNIESKFEINDFKLKIENTHLDKGLNSIYIEFKSPFDRNGVGFHRYLDPVDNKEYHFSDLEPFECHKIFPCFDQPDLKAIFYLKVEVPKSFVVISNTPEISNIVKKDRRFVEFTKSQATSTYLFSVVCGDFVTIEDPKNDSEKIPLRIFCRESMRQYVDEKEFFEITRQGFSFYEDFLQIPYPYIKYDSVFCPEYTMGAMENTGLITFTESYLHKHKATTIELMDFANTIVHEECHMWFGNLVTMKWWGDLWMNEAFATYLAFIALQRNTKHKQSLLDFSVSMKGGAIYEDERSTTHPVIAICDDTNTAFANFDGITYNKGASAMKQLHFLLGEEQFTQALRDYLQKHAHGNVIPSDLVDAFQKHTSYDMTRWFDEWLNTSGVNTTYPKLTIKNNKIDQFFIEQIPSKDNDITRLHRTKIGLFYEENNKLQLKHETIIDFKGKITQVNSFSNLELPDFIFTNLDDEDYIKPYLDEKSQKYLQTNINKIDDELTRQLVYNSLNYMVTDITLNPIEFSTLIFDAIDEETSETIYPTILSFVGQYYSSYFTKEKKSQFSNKYFDFVLKHLNDKSLSHDKQSAWFNLFFQFCKFENKLHYLIDAFNKQKVGVFELDIVKKWNICKTLSFFKHTKTNDFLQILLSEDHGDNVERNKLQIEVALSNDKQNYFDLILHDKELSVERLKSYMKGLFSSIQKRENDSLVAKYFDNCESIFNHSDRIHSQNYGSILFPFSHSEESLDHCHKILSKDLHSNLRRSLKENLHYLEIKQSIQKKYM